MTQQKKKGSKLRQYNRFMEFFWLAISVGTLVVGIYIWGSKGLEEASMSFVFSIVAFVLSYSRKRYRKAIDKKINDKSADK